MRCRLFILVGLTVSAGIYAIPDDVTRAGMRTKGALNCAILTAKLNPRQNDLLGFLRSIQKEPNEDTTLEVLADYLADTGEQSQEARGQLLRLQVALSKLLGQYNTHTIDDLPVHEIIKAREWEQEIKGLLNSYGKRWIPNQRQWPAGIKGVEFRRGIIDGVVLDLEWVENNSVEMEQFIRRHPEIVRYSFQKVNPYGAGIFLGLRGIERIRHLAFEDGNLSGHLDLFTENGRLKNLERLDLDNHPIGEMGIWALAASPHLKNLKNLGRLTRYGIGANEAARENQLIQWVGHAVMPLKLRKEAYLELLERGRMSFFDLNRHFNSKDRIDLWKQVLSEGRFQRRMGEENLEGAIKLYLEIPAKPPELAEHFFKVYLERTPVPLRLAREIESGLKTGYVTVKYEFIDRLLNHELVLQGDPDRKENRREDFRLLNFLRHVHQNRDASHKVNPALLGEYQSRYEKEAKKFSSREVFERAAKQTKTEEILKGANPESFEFRKVNGGTMVLGSEENEWTLPLSSFELQATQFTRRQLEPIRKIFNKKAKKAGVDPYPEPAAGEDLDRPLTASWKDAKLICEILTEIDPTHQYDLPTESQWEYAVRGGTRSAYYYGGQVRRLGEYGWGNFNAGGASHAVGQLKPNALGFYDMIGNMWEWARDVYTEDTTQLSGRDPEYQGTGDYRVLRGGSWRYDPQRMQSAYRNYDDPSCGDGDFGFRLLRTPK